MLRYKCVNCGSESTEECDQCGICGGEVEHIYTYEYLDCNSRFLSKHCEAVSCTSCDSRNITDDTS